MQIVADVIKDAGLTMVFHQQIDEDVPWADYKAAEVSYGHTVPVLGWQWNSASPRVTELLRNY